MIWPDNIPDEVVEVAARAVCEAENGPCKCLPDECGCTYWLAHARASIAAALNAWPGRSATGGFDHDGNEYAWVQVPLKLEGK